ncbi:E3 ubiquitin/ISG15 ligase TRIM25 isoform X2 [Notolabrus celidotus]|uniref:E3 ubiquitin/ISG15 ligase TRIM25 isoform X2 n=1 Tax=Notolabrus celidotus TaxID=1203425 RepID=UPI00149029BE|nr:E3 ubiquitin/ISG15 ligase TRIM25 isoform X2 [Notolabrus celidotus]
MADVDESPFSLMSLEDELTCSICLSPFDCPVTLPCGHNFCQDCLLASWKDTYSCPQCRTLFATKPELKKNTVLSTVVETFTLRSNKKEGEQVTEETHEKEEEKKDDVIRCDTCMEAEASQTCLTCMASFCEEHLRPHRENPVFRLHHLSKPVGDLLERICPDHNKLMELFCSKHGRPICSLCLQQVHKGCPFISPEEQRNQKESDLRNKSLTLAGKITKNETILSQMTDIQNRLKNSAINRKEALVSEYQQMRDMLAREERDSLTAVDREMETGQLKLDVLRKKFTENVNNLTKAKEDIHNLLTQSHTLDFLKASFDLPQSASFEPYSPQITLDSKKVTATQAFASALKQHLTEIFKQPVETRLLTLNPEVKTSDVESDKKEPPASGPSESDSQKQKRKPRSHSPGRPPVQPNFQPAPGFQYGNFYQPRFPHGEMRHPGPRIPLMRPGPFLDPEWQTFMEQHRLPRPNSAGSQPKEGQKKKAQKNTKKGSQSEDKKGNKNKNRSMENLLDLDEENKTPAAESTQIPETTDVPPNITSAEKRSELLKYGTVLTLDRKTAHKRIELKEGFTVATVSDEHADYPDCPERFAVCSQVLASKGFSRGRHYWEVKMSSNNFIGIGLAYKSIDRKGPTSRLGRNAQSWCVEWFNVKLSAWHNSSETVLENPNSKRVGVLLDCENGVATFYNVADRAYPFHSFVFPFAEAVYPAFWIFSSGSSISLCKLQP